MSQLHEINHVSQGDRTGEQGDAAEIARETLSREAFDLATPLRHRAPKQLDATPGAAGSTPSCMLPEYPEPSRDSKSERAIENKAIKTYRYPDGTTITDYANGDSVKTQPEGNKVTTRRDGTMIFQDRHGKVNMVVGRDGTTSQYDHKRGTKTTEYPDGRVVIEEKNGTKTQLNRGHLSAGKLGSHN